jgi:hypothetical protein
MPDSSAGTKEFYSAWIARVGAVSAPGFHRQMFHMEHCSEDRKAILFLKNQFKKRAGNKCSTWNICVSETGTFAKAPNTKTPLS